MKRTCLHILCSLFLLALPDHGQAAVQEEGRRDPIRIQETQESSNPYQVALQYFREGRYTLAGATLDAALKTGGLGSKRASAWLLLGAARLGSDAPEQVLQALDGLDREYPEGPYLLERRWLRAHAHMRAGRFYEAAVLFAEIASEGEAEEGRLGAVARDELATLMSDRLRPAEMQRLGNELAGTDLKGWITLVAAEELANRGDLARTRRVLEGIEAEAPESGYSRQITERIESLSDRLSSTGPAPLVIGVLAPLTGPNAEQGREIVNAVNLAIAMSGPGTELKIRNTDSTMEGTIAGTLSLIEEEGAQILIGPVGEDFAMVAAGIAEAENVPIILPHTHGAFASGLGENVYQLQATPVIMARKLADVAVDSLGMRTFAVLSPLVDDWRSFSEAFVSQVEEKGANVIAIQEYYPGTWDFQTQLQAIRREALRLSLADTSNISVTDEYALARANEDTSENLVPVGSLDALIAPGMNVEEVIYIASQVQFLYLVTTIMGGPVWNSYDVVQRGQPYVRGAVFTDTYSFTRTSMPQINFANNYYAAYLEHPGRAATLAFDAAGLAIAAWQMAPTRRGTDRQAALRIWLSGVSSYEGASGPINLGRNARVNDNVYLFHIQQDTIAPLTFTSLPPASREER